MGLLRRPTTSKIVEDGRSAGPAGRARIRAHSRKPGCGYAANPHFNCRTSTSRMVGAGPVRMLTAANVAASATGTDSPPCDPTPPAWQAPTRVMPAHQLRVPAVIETGNAKPAPTLLKLGRKPTIACEPMVSSLTEVAKLLQPGRCVT